MINSQAKSDSQATTHSIIFEAEWRRKGKGGAEDRSGNVGSGGKGGGG